MDSDFIERIQRITLTPEKDQPITVRAVHREKILEEYSLSLIGKFLTTRPMNLKAAKNLLRSVWKPGSDLKIVDVGDGLLQFKFVLESQLRWVWDNGSWSFDNNILALQRWEKGLTARTVSFKSLSMWGQVWGLPFDLINEEAGLDIGRGIGSVVEVDYRALASEQAHFLHIRVEVLLDKPIQRGGQIVSLEGDRSTLEPGKTSRCGKSCGKCPSLKPGIESLALLSTSSHPSVTRSLVKEHPELEGKFKERVQEAVKYASTIKDFDELVYPCTLARNWLGSEPSPYVLRALDREENNQMTTKFNKEMYVKIKGKKNEPLSNIGQKRLRIIDKEKEKETVERGLSTPTLDEGRTASPGVSIEEVVLPSKKQKTGDKGKEKIGSNV
ncbi:hypothetical protein SO802_005567 [Lithocarpus litseifolius]|uniref:DUF4283 domain-containing protein n=1 Tax=Lithocarpus litseifolius TaxID=425828 RepID=A0AAW2DK18_9ROSI